MDGIKPTLSDLNDDQTPVFEPVKLDLLHASGPKNLDPSIPEPSARVAPITPPFHATPESNVEFVANEPEPTPEPTPEAQTPVPDKIQDVTPAPVFDKAPVSSVTDTSAPAPIGSTGSGPITPPRRGGKGPLIVLIIILLLLAGGGAAYYFLVLKKAPAAQAPVGVPLAAVAPTKLTQQEASGSLATGASSSVVPTFGATLSTKATTGSAKLQVEVEAVGTAFTGTPSATGQSVSADGSDLALTVNLKSLPVGSYHWQARTEVGTTFSAWVPNSSATATTPDFVIVAAAPPTAPTVSAVGGGTVSGTSLTTTQNQPALSGTTAAGSTLSITVTPDNITLTPKVAADGSWTVTPTQQLSNGTHTLALTATDTSGNHSQASYTLNINPVATVPTTPNVASSTQTTTPTTTPSTSASTSTATATPTATASSTPAPGNLASTGQSTTPLTLAAMIVGIAACLGLVYLRYYDRRHHDERG